MSAAPTESGPVEHANASANMHCPWCRYDLTGIESEVCPECGGPASERERTTAIPRAGVRRMAIVVFIASALPAWLLGICIGLGVKSWIVAGIEVIGILWLPIGWLSVPTFAGVWMLRIARRSARSPDASAASLVEVSRSCGGAVVLILLLGWVIPFLLMTNVCWCCCGF